MSRGLNKVMLIGWTGKEPEVRYTETGKVVANTSLAVNDVWKDKNGQKQERTEWVNLVAWGPLAEVFGQWVKKGTHIYVEGRLQTRKWQDNDGRDRHTTEVVVVNMNMLDSRSERTGPNQSDTSEAQPDDPPDFDDEIPF